jgi:predicted metal-binding membrane protein
MSTLRAARAQPWVLGAVLGAAALAWLSTAERMSGMDAGPGSDLGTLGWFIGVWVVMMAAMMLPSLAPTVAVYAERARRVPGPVLVFAGGYLLVWAIAGVAAYGLFELGRNLFGEELAWDQGGRWVTAGVLLIAALYQLTPYKRAFLRRCRRPLQVEDPDATEGSGAFATGLRNGGWCLGCSWALMAALFALGVMSLTWMALIAALVAFEKLGPSARTARLTTAGVLVLLAGTILLVPHDVPGLVVPGSPSSMHSMSTMGMGAN